MLSFIYYYDNMYLVIYQQLDGEQSEKVLIPVYITEIITEIITNYLI